MTESLLSRVWAQVAIALDRAASGAARSLWRMQWKYLQAERSLLAYVARLGGVLPTRSVAFPGHVEPDARFGPTPDRHHPALVEVPIVWAGWQEDRTSTSRECSPAASSTENLWTPRATT
ncbi:hypothetical protein [Actinosynnema sp.]|uniref:hypothetical protein n=1 Tax=Actinosynnema sp. TaxID=1872144 RepID=UPI003F8379C4